MSTPETPPVVSIVGKKNSGKTTLTVALAAELKRRGVRVASLKHGHHGFEIDHPGRDSWRHFHEGEVEAVLVAASDRIALVMRNDGREPEAPELVERFFAGRGYDLVLAEGYKAGPFPKVEVFRRAVHAAPLYDPGEPAAAALFLGMVTDDAALRLPIPTIPLDPDGAHVARVADLVEEHLRRVRDDGA
jgi:molybdopterin-guanine dinucleotide biosynthesis protein B